MRSLGTTSADIVAMFVAEDAMPLAYVVAAPSLVAARTSPMREGKGERKEKGRDDDSRRNKKRNGAGAKRRG